LQKLQIKNFINISDHSSNDLRAIIDEAKARKLNRKNLNKSAPDEDKPFEGKSMAMIFEKPSTRKAPSNKAVIGRYILPKLIFKKLLNQKKGKGGEIHITDAIQSLIYDNNKFVAHNFLGKYLDCGTMNGYINSSTKIRKLWNYAW